MTQHKYEPASEAEERCYVCGFTEDDEEHHDRSLDNYHIFDPAPSSGTPGCAHANLRRGSVYIECADCGKELKGDVGTPGLTEDDEPIRISFPRHVVGGYVVVKKKELNRLRALESRIAELEEATAADMDRAEARAEVAERQRDKALAALRTIEQLATFNQTTFAPGGILEIARRALKLLLRSQQMPTRSEVQDWLILTDAIENYVHGSWRLEHRDAHRRLVAGLKDLLATAQADTTG